MATRAKTQAACAFSLVEILVVITILAVLAAILVPGLVAAKKRAEQGACASNLRQIGIALLSYHNDYNMLPIGWAGEDYTWNSALKKYLTTYNAGGNANRVRIKLACPSIPRQDEYHYNYMYNDNLFYKNIGSIVKPSLRPVVTDAENIATNLTLTGNVKEVHHDGANYLFLDGRVQWQENPDEAAWQGTGSQFQ